MSPGPWAHPGPRTFWLGGGCEGGRLSEGQPSPTLLHTHPVPRSELTRPRLHSRLLTLPY